MIDIKFNEKKLIKMRKNSRIKQIIQDRIYGQNKIICNNKLILGEKYYAILMTFFMFSIPYFLSIIIIIKSSALNLSQNLIYIIISSILYIIHIYSMIKGGTTDPGILPRQNKDAYYETKRANMRYQISGHIHRLNYCYSCYLFRPSRTSHCAVCDNCVERFDHHCLWLGTCIGKRNYKFFFMLLGSLNINAIFEISFCIYVLVIEIKKIKNKETKVYIYAIIIGIILLYNTLFVVIFIGKLFITHTYLVIKGLTFYEYSKEKMNVYKGINPFDKYNFFSNKFILFVRNYKSYLLDALNQQENYDNKSDIHIIKFKSKKNKKTYKNNQIKFIKEKNEKNSSNLRARIIYLNTYQENFSLCLKKKSFGNNIILQNNKKKKTDDYNNVNSSKRTIGPITLDFNAILNSQTQKLNKYNSSSNSSKEIDFEQNKNVVINPYCLYIEKNKKTSNKNIESGQNENTLIKRNENRVESPFHEIEVKHKNIMFSNL